MIHKGRKIGNLQLETQVYQWICTMHAEDLAISTQDIIDKALSLNDAFLDGLEKLWDWVYKFMRRNGLCLRARTRVTL